MPPIRLQTLFYDILYLIFTHLSLATLGNMVRFLPSHLRNIAMDVFKSRILAQILHGTSSFHIFYYEDPFIIPAITLIDATRSQTPGPIIIHYNDNPENGSINPSIPFHLISEIGITIPELDHLPGFRISFSAESNFDSKPKRYMSWELVSSWGRRREYKFILQKNMDGNRWAGYFAEWIEVRVKARIDQGLYQVEDVYFKFEDLFYL